MNRSTVSAWFRRSKTPIYIQYKIDVHSKIDQKNYRDAILVALVNWLRMCGGTLEHWPDVTNPLRIVVLLRTSEYHLKWQILHFILVLLILLRNGWFGWFNWCT